MSEKSKCTLCAKVESPGFYTGCMIKDGACSDSGWECDGNGNLTRETEPDWKRPGTLMHHALFHGD